MFDVLIKNFTIRRNHRLMKGLTSCFFWTGPQESAICMKDLGKLNDLKKTLMLMAAFMSNKTKLARKYVTTHYRPLKLLLPAFRTI